MVQVRIELTAANAAKLYEYQHTKNFVSRDEALNDLLDRIKLTEVLE